ncbi:MAG: aspartate/glutamate racemase family protein, partial [Pseudomonadota bacterium]
MTGPRIALIHALGESVAPAAQAFVAIWPEARPFNLLDDSLSADLAAAGALNPDIAARFLALSRYAAGTGAAGILFTCSAFGPAIEACKRALAIPVVKPNEAALEAALEAGARIGLLATFAGTIPSMRVELEALAAATGRRAEIETRVVPGALEALKAGRHGEHDELVARAAAACPELDALVLAQFSMARAANRIAPVAGRSVLTTPERA